MRELSQSYLDHARVEHRNVLARKQLIEARKEYIESQSRAKVCGWTLYSFCGREGGRVRGTSGHCMVSLEKVQLYISSKEFP